MKTKVKIFFGFIVMLIITGFSTFIFEDKIGHVVYKIGKYSIENKDNKPISKLDKDSFKKIDQEFEFLTFNLFFNKNESLYILQDAIDGENDDNFEIKFVKMMAGGLCYKNNLLLEKIEQIESFNKIFNVVKPHDEYKWEISSETKIINGFKCYKATTVKEEFDEIRKIKRRFTPIVWFSPEIPVPFGPKGLDGLPGLVLEATFNGRLYYYATNINLDYNGKITIEKPSKGKYVSEKEFHIIDTENFKKNTE